MISETFSHNAEKYVNPYLDYDHDDIQANEMILKRKEDRKLLLNAAVKK